jgi:hypothetical protein
MCVCGVPCGVVLCQLWHVLVGFGFIALLSLCRHKAYVHYLVPCIHVTSQPGPSAQRGQGYVLKQRRLQCMLCIGVLDACMHVCGMCCSCVALAPQPTSACGLQSGCGIDWMLLHQLAQRSCQCIAAKQLVPCCVHVGSKLTACFPFKMLGRAWCAWRNCVRETHAAQRQQGMWCKQRKALARCLAGVMPAGTLLGSVLWAELPASGSWGVLGSLTKLRVIECVCQPVHVQAVSIDSSLSFIIFGRCLLSCLTCLTSRVAAGVSRLLSDASPSSQAGHASAAVCCLLLDLCSMTIMMCASVVCHMPRGMLLHVHFAWLSYMCMCCWVTLSQGPSSC